jgi:hypothetical protein
MSTKNPSDRRKAVLGVTVAHSVSGATFNSVTYDIGANGFFIAGVHDLNVGDQITVRFHTPSADELIPVQCEIVWVQGEPRGERPAGAGVRILSSGMLESRAFHALKRLATAAVGRLTQHPAVALIQPGGALEKPFLVERYFIYTAMLHHLSIAIRNIRDVEIKALLTKFLFRLRMLPSALEWTLGDMGVSPELLIDTEPTAATAGCTAFLSELAHTELVAYLVTLGFGEPTELSVGADKFPPLPRRQFRSLRTLTDEIFQLVPLVHPSELRRASEALRTWYDLYALVLDALQEGAPLARRYPNSGA